MKYIPILERDCPLADGVLTAVDVLSEEILVLDLFLEDGVLTVDFFDFFDLE
jgi:hypothetical protein